MSKETLETKDVENFNSLLKEFNSINQSSPKAKAQLEALKEKALITTLTVRQRDAIIARCKSVEDGSYGTSKRPEHFGHEKPQKNKPPENK